MSTSKPKARTVWYWFDASGEQPASRVGEAFRTTALQEQSASSAVAMALHRRVGYRVTLSPFGPWTYLAKWFDVASNAHKEASVEIVR